VTSPRDGSRRTVPALSLQPNLPLGRAPITCLYKCGDACAHEPPNTSNNEYFGDVLASMASRRGVLRAGAVVAGAVAGAAAGGTLLAQSAAAAPGMGSGGPPGSEPPGTRFEPVRPNRSDMVTIPRGYQQQIVVRWGDPIIPGGPEFDFEAQSEQSQSQQFGFNNDFCGLVPLNGNRRWLMVSNHEYTSETFMFRGYDPANPTEHQVRVGWAAHGMSVVVVERGPHGGLRMVQDAHYNRRTTATSEFELRGPVAGSPYLRTAGDPTGTVVLGSLNNCAGGVTPWGTVLSGEENFNQYFANAGLVTDPVARARFARYGITTGASERKWERFDPRFNIVETPNEVNRFGYIVEIDPYSPDERPVKHTALGRLKHEAATIQVARDGRVVVYQGDDERFDYIYKFVSDERMLPGNSRRAREHNKRLLDAGTLYVAKFLGDSPPAEIDGSGLLPSDGEFDGVGVWIPLAHNDVSFVSGFTAEEVYIFTRLAADAAGPTKMDRPEDMEPHPYNGRIYCALTNNSQRGTTGNPGPDEANPRNRNQHGHVLEMEETGGDHTGTTFSWRLLLVCGNPTDANTYFGGFPKDQVSPISCPDNLAFDRYGNLWIATDGNALGSNDGLFSVPLDGPHRGHVKQFLTVPIGAETCGPVIEDGFVLVSVQHPGELSGASADNPMSHWPDGGETQPRPSVVAVWPS
jgi:secreted PhoX family phosphatase